MSDDMYCCFRARELEDELARLRSEIATLMGHNAEYAKRHVAQLAETERLRSEIALRDQERERCFQLLQAAGIPRERAKSTDNGIGVLTSRYDKQIAAIREDIALRDRCITWCLQNFAGRGLDGAILRGTPMSRKHELGVPAEFAAIISGKADQA